MYSAGMKSILDDSPTWIVDPIDDKRLTHKKSQHKIMRGQ